MDLFVLKCVKFRYSIITALQEKNIGENIWKRLCKKINSLIVSWF